MKKMYFLLACFCLLIQQSYTQLPCASSTPGITVAGGNGYGAASNQIGGPADVFIDRTGIIYIVDDPNNRIQKWAPGASEGITVADGNGQGSAPNQLSAPYGVFVDVAGNIYVAELSNNRIQKFANSSITKISCPADLKFVVTSCNDKVSVIWIEPRDTFPNSFPSAGEIDPGNGTFTFMGALNGNGYYRSTGTLLWQSARDVARSIGANGHLVIINSAKETNLIFSQIKNSGYAPWIGLSNTGRQGRFRWVNGERLTYTNWAPGEPNNYGGSPRNITEPYVRMLDTSGAWNDQRDDYLPFIVEFEKPLIRYRQLSGPRNGSNQKPGVYTVCYERRNFITDKRDTCCFSVTVTCDSTLNTQATGIVSANTPALEKISNGLQVTTSPNPSSHTFRLNITSDNSEKISLQVTDVSGRVVETRNGVSPKQPLLIGAGYRTGIYFAQLMQGNKTTMIKLIKQAK